MAGVFSIGAALLSFGSLVFVAISMASNYWVHFDDDRSSGSGINPLTFNTELSNLELKYDLDYFGLWVGCHREVDFRKISCGYIGSSCRSNICWIRNNDDEACLRDRVRPIKNCSAYQATRAMTVIGTLFLILGASILVVTVFVSGRSLSMGGAVSTLIAGLFLMIAFAVFQGAVYNGNNLGSEAGIGWSFAFLIVSWILALLGGLVGLIASSQESKDDGREYEETE